MQSKGLWLALGYKMTHHNAMHNRESAQQVYPDRNPMRTFAPTTISQLASMRTFAPTTINHRVSISTLGPTNKQSACTNTHILRSRQSINQHVRNHFGSILFL
jgi:hypothetical protein